MVLTGRHSWTRPKKRVRLQRRAEREAPAAILQKNLQGLEPTKLLVPRI